MAKFTDEHRKIGAGWLRTDNGRERISIILDVPVPAGARLIAYRTDDKFRRSDKTPDYKIYIRNEYLEHTGEPQNQYPVNDEDIPF